MNKQLTIEELNKILDAHLALQNAVDAARKAGCLDIDGPLYNAIWKGFEDTVNVIDPDGWIMWYIYENDFGNKGLHVKLNDHREFPVENRRDLLIAINCVP